MKKFVFIILVLCLSIYIIGCGKKQATLEELQTPMSMETPSTVTSETKAMPETKPQVTQGAPVAQAKLEPLPPSGPYKPTVQETQTALKNAGFYTGNIDGKSGPVTMKAIEEFQKSKGLAVDGKVGSKTWSVLSAYLKPVVPEAKPKKKVRP